MFRRWSWILVIGIVLIDCDFIYSLDNVNKPDIILLVADDLGFNDVPWHNNEVIAPNIQKLASEGVILENSYVQPVCSPTRSALLSGRYPFTIGRQDGIIRPLMPTGLTLSVPIIPQLLKPLGYETHAVGKWHLGFCNWSYTPTERGFDTFNGFYLGSEDYYLHTRNVNTDSGYDFRVDRQPDLQAQGIYSSFLFASSVEEILRSSDSGNPKFLYVPFQNVHAPLQVPENYTIPYTHILDKNRRIYLGMVSAMDEAIGRIVDALKESNRYNNSIIIFTSDNGGPTVYSANNWPLRGNKTTLWEGGTRGAAFIHSPFLKNRGRVSYNLIHTTDWLSTIVGLAGGNAPNDTDSVDQWEALNEIKEGPRKEMIYNINNNEHIGFQAAIRVEDYKLLVGNPGPGEWTPPPLRKTTSVNLNSFVRENSFALKDDSQTTFLGDYISNGNIFDSEIFGGELAPNITMRLYNIKDDPEERNNLAKDEPAVVDFLFQRLISYEDRWVDPDVPEDDPKGDPSNWEGIWSPGWC